MKNNIMVVALTVLCAIMAGLSIVLGIGRAVEVSSAPVKIELVKLIAAQDKLEQKISGLENEVKALRQAPQPSRMTPPEPPKLDLTTVHEIPLDGSYIAGSQAALVTIVGFNDFQCPYCARFYPPIKDVLAAYPKDVRFVLKHFPLGFHPNARPAAKAAMAAGLQGKFYEMTDVLLQNNQSLTEEKFKEFAAQLGLNVDQFTKDFKEKDAEWERKIQEDMALASKIGVGGTPMFYLNGRLTLSRDTDAWKREIDAILQAKPAQE